MTTLKDFELIRKISTNRFPFSLFRLPFFRIKVKGTGVPFCVGFVPGVNKG